MFEFSIPSCDSLLLFNCSQELLPSTRRSAIHFDDHFNKAGLEDLVKFRRNQESSACRKKLQEELNEVLVRDDDVKSMVEDIIKSCNEYQQNKTLTDSDISVMVGSVFGVSKV